jgi:general stress protein YciG
MADRNKDQDSDNEGQMTVEEAGRKGGEATSRTHGHEFYEKIGHKGGEAGGEKGGQKVKELIEAGKEAEGEDRS